MEIEGFDITPASGNAGADTPISIGITAINEGLDKIVKVEAICGDKTVLLTLTHEGMREKYITADDEEYITVDDKIYGCLK